MNHPTKEAVLKVAFIFNVLAKDTTNQVDGWKDRIILYNDNNNVAIKASHSGWYAFYHKVRHHEPIGMRTEWDWYYDSVGITPKTKMIVKKADDKFALWEDVKAEDGCALLAEHLNFDSVRDLRLWAGMNPKIWGNSDGNEMFGANEHMAFRVRRDDYTLNHIADHWESVAGRIPTEV